MALFGLQSPERTLFVNLFPYCLFLLNLVFLTLGDLICQKLNFYLLCPKTLENLWLADTLLNFSITHSVLFMNENTVENKHNGEILILIFKSAPSLFKN